MSIIVGSVLEVKPEPQRQIFQTLITETKVVEKEARRLSEESENATTEEDIDDGIAELVSAATESQIIASELREIAKETNTKGDIDTANSRADFTVYSFFISSMVSLLADFATYSASKIISCSASSFGLFL
jgi:hypothetical protein